MKVEVQADSHERRFPLFLLRNDGAAPRSGEDDSA